MVVWPAGGRHDSRQVSIPSEVNALPSALNHSPPSDNPSPMVDNQSPPSDNGAPLADNHTLLAVNRAYSYSTCTGQTKWGGGGQNKGILPPNLVTPFPHQYFFNVEKPCKCLLGSGGCEVIEDDFAETCAKKLPLMAMA